jgi:hypothetical protein
MGGRSIINTILLIDVNLPELARVASANQKTASQAGGSSCLVSPIPVDKALSV